MISTPPNPTSVAITRCERSFSPSSRIAQNIVKIGSVNCSATESGTLMKFSE